MRAAHTPDDIPAAAAIAGLVAPARLYTANNNSTTEPRAGKEAKRNAERRTLRANYPSALAVRIVRYRENIRKLHAALREQVKFVASRRNGIAWVLRSSLRHVTRHYQGCIAFEAAHPYTVGINRCHLSVLALFKRRLH